MNPVDAVVLATAMIGLVAGIRLGFVTRAASWLGALALLAAVAPWIPRLGDALQGRSASQRVIVTTVVLGATAAIGSTVGGLVGRRVRPRHIPVVQQVDRVLGAVIGFVPPFIMCWLLAPTLAAVPGWPARAARDSHVIAFLHDYAPAQPAAVRSWAQRIARSPLSGLVDPFAATSAPPPPGTVALDAATQARVRASVVLVQGDACGSVQSGTGWVEAPGVVVTNAHVVAGEHATTVTDAGGVTRAALVVAFDPVADVAVLRVEHFTASPLPVAAPVRQAAAASFGHPGGGPLEVTGVRIGDTIQASGTDIYGRGTSDREVVVLGGELAPGDSGSPVVDASGRVVAMAFAVDPADHEVAYALGRRTYLPVVERAANRTVTTGACTSH